MNLPTKKQLNQWKDLLRDLPVSVNNFYGDPTLQQLNTLGKLENLLKEKHRGPVGLITKGKLTQKQLVQLFDKPVESGGFSLYKQTAINIGQRVSELTKNISIFKTEPKNETDLEKRVIKVTDYLIEKYQLNLNFDQTCRLKELLTDRFNFKLPENRFNQKIDQPLTDGGLGLNARTSKKIAREVKLIMFNKKFKEDAS